MSNIIADTILAVTVHVYILGTDCILLGETVQNFKKRITEKQKRARRNQSSPWEFCAKSKKNL